MTVWEGKPCGAESRLVVETMSELLKAGFDVDLAMKNSQRYSDDRKLHRYVCNSGSGCDT